MTASPQWKLREELAEYSIDELQRKLIKVDKITFESLNESDRYNPHRLIRKIEIATSTKKTPPSVTPLRTKVASIIGLRFAQPKKMKDAITQRVYARLTQGAIQEVKNLLNEGYTKSDPGLQTIGYQQIMSFLSGELTEEQAIEQWIRAEIKYAKRQNTFMKKDDHIIWMER